MQVQCGLSQQGSQTGDLWNNPFCYCGHLMLVDWLSGYSESKVCDFTDGLVRGLGHLPSG